MEEEKEVRRIDLNKIKFEYKDGVPPDNGRQTSIILNLNMWLDNFIEEINKEEKGEINVFFAEGDNNHVSFNNMDDELTAKIYKHMQNFAFPNILHRWHR
ncbi:MAG TPA: hypothetical protein VHB48_21495 [Chitinophagaceae bacterium]|nr:hypothetical protein [Chitinophagaceae bacterium]